MSNKTSKILSSMPFVETELEGLAIKIQPNKGEILEEDQGT